MIIRPAGTHLLFVTQPDHAALAAELMAEWRADGFPTNPRRETLLLATREHDNGWHELDAQPLVDGSGRVRDFLNMPAGTHTQVWPRGIARLAAHPYAAALVAQHALHLFRDHRGEADYDRFFSTVESARDRHLAEAGLDRETLARDYFIVRIGDLLSLAFCNGWTEPQREGIYSIWTEGLQLLVDPDPFGGRQIRIAIPARRVEAQPFPTSEAAERAFATAALEPLIGVAAGARGPRAASA